MIDIENKIVHLDIFNEYFCCDLKKCKGICCVEGDSGAPIEIEEEIKLKQILPIIIDELTDQAKQTIEEHGVSMIDVEGELTTSICGDSGPCVFVQIDKNDIAYCVIEKFWEKGLIDFRKPISCHLYPLRIHKYNSFEALNYHMWDICKDARILGKKLDLKIFQFLKEPLIRKYGKEWYDELLLVVKQMKENNGIK
ncbi:MAG: DUF3109 family protein [Bacteroidales bacterium]|jgi:hypothetical protein|nr:DUF3109 family protein [Bacteroidales bacterium]MCK9498380.1 DUF3109 family protein [Bacteroidales bacterium]MDY0314180.1 DUF3109 family protein [Bacteroidales bacterium]NLB86372.1 DUF3109 family protein [Bacteroidales bacterium]